MSSSRVKDGNFFVIQSFMVTDLHLKGNELLIYAIIYGFSQDDQHFKGSLQYLADWTNCSRQAVIDNLKSLIHKGLLKKFVYQTNGVTFCEYQARFQTGSQESVPPRTESLPGGSQKSLPGGSQKSLPNNIDIDNISDNIADNIVGPASPAAGSRFQSALDLCKSCGITVTEGVGYGY